MSQTVDPVPIQKTLVATVLAFVLLIALTAAQLTWLDRADRVGGVMASFIGPFVGMMVVLPFVARKQRQRQRRPRPHGLAWHLAGGILVSAGALLLLTALNGGVDGDVVVPTVVLALVGGAAFTALIRLVTPEQML
jgi:drug/metabolite transporter (DMT)-like permease